MSSDAFARRKLLGILSGSWVAQACYALAKLGIPDMLRDSALSGAELASRSGADPVALQRLLRVLASTGILKSTSDGYGLTSVGQLLRSDVDDSLLDTALIHGEEIFRCFAEIEHTVRTGQPAFTTVFGTPFYDYLADHPQVADRFSIAMGAASVPVMLGELDLSGVDTLVDVGGGSGGVLAEALRTHPDLRGVLVELPEALRSAGKELAAAGVADRVTLHAGSFFDTVPGGGTVYVLSRVLHNWTDEHATVILRRVREAMPEHGRLVVFEEFTDGKAPMVDLLMLVMLEGYDRTGEQYAELISSAGFEITAVRTPAGAGAGNESLIEARRGAG